MSRGLIRVDGSHKIGLGHVMRCLAVAQGLTKAGIKSLFVIRDHEKSVSELIQRYGYPVETVPHECSFGTDASLTIDIIEQNKSETNLS